MNLPIVVVTGLSRCGSSLMMQMLHAGGMPVSCEPGNEQISGEHNSNIESIRMIAADQVQGKAIKVLEPLNFQIPPNKEYIFIWCIRDFTEQGKSICKFVRSTGLKVNEKDEKKITESLRYDTLKSIKYLEKIGKVYICNFERVIDLETQEHSYIAEVLKPYFDLDVTAMKSVVIKRSPECYNGFLEHVLIQRAEK